MQENWMTMLSTKSQEGRVVMNGGSDYQMTIEAPGTPTDTRLCYANCQGVNIRYEQ